MVAHTVARVDMEIQDNGTWQDAFRFGDPEDTTWDLVDESFIMDVKGNSDEPLPLLTLSVTNGRIIVDDDQLRVIHLNVSGADIKANIPAQEDSYVYDLVMFNDETPPRRVPLMRGRIRVRQGITEE